MAPDSSSSSAPPPPPDLPGNRLAAASSAYLLQHSQNPVDWYPWGPEALARAQELDRPLLVSVGYSACHWCHVMERESFENEATAEFMNAHFICIKVDREERPDVDQIYMDAVVRLNQGQGGWPLTAFCLPDGSPFFGGTYYPDEPRHGMPSFRQVLEALADAYLNRRGEVEDAARQVVASLQVDLGAASGTPVGSEAATRACELLMRGADHDHGGFGPGPKFPTPTNLEFFLAAIDLLPAAEARPVALHLTRTAREMARRGLYDHLAGGFHRYCVDGDWTIPHFEKMLYDQGLLLRFYAELLRRGGEAEELAWPIRETVDYLRREMTSPEGGFYASQDADAEGREGSFQVWTPAEVESVLGEAAEEFCQAYGVNEAGNFEEGSTHLIDQKRAGRELFSEERAQLLIARQKRVAPDTDKKRVAAWNGYAISGLVRAGDALTDPTMLTDATTAMDFILDEMVDSSGRLHRIFNRGLASVPAFLDDHAALLDACLDLFRAGAGERFLTAALHFGQEIGDRFIDEDRGEIFFTANDGEKLVHRPQSDHDGATPAAAGLAAVGLIRLAHLAQLQPIAQQAELIIMTHAPLIERSPHALPTLLRAMILAERGVSVALIRGDEDAPQTQALAAQARRVLLPDDGVVVLAPGAPRPVGVGADWLRDREGEPGQATAWICQGTRCSLPITDPSAIEPLSSTRV
ncbi:MAG: thioredoxin domain-containing protein [Myxococcota bacterium]|nr:thioredoxin domain-containing protein [Myxococcota bacterium]